MLSGDPDQGHRTPLKRPRHFQLKEENYEAVERKVGPDNARAWIAKTSLSVAKIELTRQEGVRREPDRFGRCTITVVIGGSR
jgi:hypothetical protein